MNGTLSGWAVNLRAFEDRCFWPGTRAMRDPARWRRQLIGRRADVLRFVDVLGQRRLVVLSGESGTGKSSFLSVGVRPQLAREGSLVLYTDRWSGGDAQADDSLEATEAFIASKLIMPAGITPGAGFLRELDERYGDTAVVVLDQFEELIRHQEWLFGRVQRWVEHAIATHSVRFVVSLRSEYEHRVRYWQAGPWQREDFQLQPLSDPETIRRIIQAGRRQADGAGAAPVIEEDAVDEIVGAWTRVEGGHAWSGVGLLHLQALLYVLWYDSDKSVVTLADVRVATERAQRAATDHLGGDRALFTDALATAVDYHLARAEAEYVSVTASEDHGDGDTVMTTGVTDMVARVADHLASGGYKVDQDRRHLARLVLDDELGTLRLDPGLTHGTLAGAVYDAFAARADAFAAAEDQVGTDDAPAADEVLDWLSCARADLVPAELAGELVADDIRDLSAGPMMGFPPLAVLVEELRRFFFALEWLTVTDLVRVATPEPDKTILSLIHDGFGVGLARWAAGRTDWVPRALGRLTAAVGETFEPPGDDQRATLSGGERFRVLVNLRWRSSTVRRMRFHRLVLVNCDLRETSFDDCEFEGVTFVNCLLDGVSFVDCHILGSATPPPRATGATTTQESNALPSFVVGPTDRAGGIDPMAGTVGVVTMLNRYRESAVPTSRLVSWTSGDVTEPIDDAGVQDLRHRSTQFRYREFDPQHGGLVMYGGRLSSLMFASCTFGDDGMISLRHVAGTSVELAEQDTGRVELADVTLRGLTFSPVVDQDHPGARIELTAYDSELQNVWFSTPLRGEARMVNCVVRQLFSASARDGGLRVRLLDSPHLGSVNAEEVELPPIDPAEFDAVTHPREDVARAARKVDYQSLRTLRRLSPRR